MNFEKMLALVCDALRDGFETPNANYQPKDSIYKLEPYGDLDQVDIMEISMHLDDALDVDSGDEYEKWQTIQDIVLTYLRLHQQKIINEVPPVSNKSKVETEVIRRVYAVDSKEYIQVAPSADVPGCVTISHKHNYWGNFEFTLDADFAIELARAITAAANEEKKFA